MFRDTWPREQISGYLDNFMVIRNLVNKNMMFQFWENKLFLSKIDIINISHTVSKWVDIRNSNFFLRFRGYLSNGGDFQIYTSYPIPIVLSLNWLN